MPQSRPGQLADLFFFLVSEGFWELVPEAGKEGALAATREIGSVGRLRALVAGPSLNRALNALR
jgi:hypothetical protein